MVTHQAVALGDHAGDAGEEVGKGDGARPGAAGDGVVPVGCTQRKVAADSLVTGTTHAVTGFRITSSRPDQAVAGAHCAESAARVVIPGHSPFAAAPKRAEHNGLAVAQAFNVIAADPVPRAGTHQAVDWPYHTGRWRCRVYKGDGAGAAVPVPGFEDKLAAAQRLEAIAADLVVGMVTDQAVARRHRTGNANQRVGERNRTGVQRVVHGIGPEPAPDGDLATDVAVVAKTSHLIRVGRSDQAVRRTHCANRTGVVIEPGHGTLAATPTGAEHN